MYTDFHHLPVKVLPYSVEIVDYYTYLIRCCVILGGSALFLAGRALVRIEGRLDGSVALCER